MPTCIINNRDLEPECVIWIFVDNEFDIAVAPFKVSLQIQRGVQVWYMWLLIQAQYTSCGLRFKMWAFQRGNQMHGASALDSS